MGAEPKDKKAMCSGLVLVPLVRVDSCMGEPGMDSDLDLLPWNDGRSVAFDSAMCNAA